MAAKSLFLPTNVIAKYAIILSKQILRMAISKQLKQEKDLLRDGKLTSQNNGYSSKINTPRTVENKPGHYG